MIGMTLTVLDNDVDALAAWQAVKTIWPYKESEDAESSMLVPDVDSSKTQDDSKAVQATIANTTEISVADTPNAPTEVPEEISMIDNTNGPLSEPKSYLETDCDGGCGKVREVISEVMICKNCNSVHFCFECHEKLQTGEFQPMICYKSHESLLVPSFDQATWETMTEDQLLVGGETKLRKEWVDKIRKDWGLQQDRIEEYKASKAKEFRALQTIARVIARWTRRKRMQRAGGGLNEPAALDP